MPLYPAKSTSFSDAVLGISCVWAIVTLGGIPWDWSDAVNVPTSLAKVYFATTLAAALVGIFRFGSTEFFRQLATLHETLSWLALVVGFPCLVSQFFINYGLEFLGNLHLLLMLPPIVSSFGRNSSQANQVDRLVSTLCVISLIGLALFSRNYSLLAATVLIVIASSVNDMHAPILSLPPVDWFHYGITCSHYFLVASLCSHDITGIRVFREMFYFMLV